MNYKSLQAKIVIIFSIPMFALIYFSSSFVATKYAQLEKSKANVLCANTAQLLTELIHSTQTERGLSAGYIVSQNESLREKLLRQYKDTDEKYKKFQEIIKLKNSQIHKLNNYIEEKDTENLNIIFAMFEKISTFRNKLIGHKIILTDELKYYIDLNKEFISVIEIYIKFLNIATNRSSSLITLQKLKEILGLQRAYVYTNILKIDCKIISLDQIRTLQLKQDLYEKKLYVNMQNSFKSVYDETIDQNLLKTLTKLKEQLFNKELNISDANLWFETSSEYISQLQSLSKKLIATYVKSASLSQENATTSLYITAFIWIGSIISYFLLLFILKTLILKEKKILEKLRVSSYTFDSHEAMVLTSVQGEILQVNSAFSDITGYTEQEVLGKNTSILKSLKHSKEFYTNMWNTLISKGKWSDEIYNKRKNGEIYLERLSITAIKDDDGNTTHYIAQFLDITDLKNAQERAEHQADHDFLTGLFNRKALTRRLQEEFSKAKRHQLTHAFLFIDLDNFKAVNDHYGHAIGDKVLIEVSTRIRALLREEDIFSRMSGDEFAVILLNMDPKRPTAALQVKEKCNKIIQQVSKEFLFGEYKIHIGASIGIRIFPNKEQSVQDVIIHADTAMYQAKNEGKNRYAFFDKKIETRLKELSVLEEELRLALENNEFKFYLQPKIDIERNTICGAEALVRWEHPRKGLLYPGVFLEAAQNIDMLPQITKLALKSVCTFLLKYRDSFQGIISININASELLSPTFEKQLTAIIQEYDIDKGQIELEILENDLIEDIELAIERIVRLRDLGFKLSIDDFGTGYSSITYLKRLPVHHLKLDRNFTQNLHDDSNKKLVKLMINMAQAFNMKTVVEGVETLEQLEFIKECGADMYQGFYCSPAVDEESFIKLLS